MGFTAGIPAYSGTRFYEPKPGKPNPLRGSTEFRHLAALDVHGVFMQIRQASESDLDAMWDIFQSVIATGDTLPFSGSLDLATFHAHWFGAHAAYVATADSVVLGMYKVGPNYPDLGSHIASATYIVSPAAQGNGIGRALVNHSIAQAQSDGFIAMQFNYVVSTNTPALKLYEKLGFSIVGTLPKAFRHQQLGLVDAHVMYRYLLQDA